MSKSLDVARAVDLLVQSDLEDPFVLPHARLYVLAITDSVKSFEVLDEDENPYRLLMRTRHHGPVRAGCLVVTGWCAPLAEADEDQLPQHLEPECRPSEHPARQRVRVSVAVTEEGIASVMRQSGKPQTVHDVPARGAGDLPDVLESWWLGTLR
ncbi:MAG: hypothetical protein RL119_1636 [Actinomycetota bacterium]